jgi:hypothetical protein
LKEEIEPMILRTALLAGTVLGLGAIAGLAGTASAATMNSANRMITGINASDSAVTKIAMRAYDPRRDGERRRYRGGQFRYFHEGYYYATPWWQVGVGVPLAPGLVVGVPTPWTPAWFSYCERKYGHFDRKTGRYYHGGRWVDCR